MSLPYLHHRLQEPQAELHAINAPSCFSLKHYAGPKERKWHLVLHTPGRSARIRRNCIRGVRNIELYESLYYKDTKRKDQILRPVVCRTSEASAEQTNMSCLHQKKIPRLTEGHNCWLSGFCHCSISQKTEVSVGASPSAIASAGQLSFILPMFLEKSV